MGKSLLFRILGVGAIPKRLRPVLYAEQIVVADEGMRGRLLSKNVKGPGKRYHHRSEGFTGCLVITKKRVACFTYWKRQINIAVDDPKIRKIFVDRPEKDILSISFESSTFRSGWDGIMEFQFYTNKAREFSDVLKSIGASKGIGGTGKTPPRPVNSTL